MRKPGGRLTRVFGRNWQLSQAMPAVGRTEDEIVSRPSRTALRSRSVLMGRETQAVTANRGVAPTPATSATGDRFRTKREHESSTVRYGTQAGPTESDPETGTTVNTTDWANRHLGALCDPATTHRIGVDRRLWLDSESDVVLEAPVDAGPAALVLLRMGRANGDDAAGCLGRLVLQGIPRLQITDEASPHWGAFVPRMGLERTPGVEHGPCTRTTARSVSALIAAQTLLPSESLRRSALAATRWLLLRCGDDGMPTADTYGRDHFARTAPTLWTALDVARAFADTCRLTQNGIFAAAARRSAAQAVAQWKRTGWGNAEPGPLDIADMTEALLGLTPAAQQDQSVEICHCWARQLDTMDRDDPDVLLGSAAAWVALSARTGDAEQLESGLQAVLRLATQTPAVAASPGINARRIRLVEDIFLQLATRGGDAIADPISGSIRWRGSSFARDPAASRHVRVVDDEGLPCDARLWACPKTFRVFGTALVSRRTDSVRVWRHGKPVPVLCHHRGDTVSVLRPSPVGPQNKGASIAFSTV